MNKVTVKHIEPSFSDERGVILDILEAEIHHTGVITFKKGAVRANHYHKQQDQYTYILSGKIELKSKDMGKEGSPTETHILGVHDLAIVPAHVAHAYKALEDTVMICLTTHERDMQSYEDDTIRIEPL